MKPKISFKTAFNQKFAREKYILEHIKLFNKKSYPEWEDFTRSFLIDLVEYFKDNLSPNSARTYCANLKSLLNKYSEEIEIPCKDYISLLSLKKGGVINTYLSPEEIQLLLNYVPENEMEHTIRNQFLLSCLTGMRFSDVIHLDATSVNNSEIVYVAQKTKSVVTTISSYVTEYLIEEQKNTIYPDWRFNEQIKFICKNAGINIRVKVVRGGQAEVGEKWEFVSSHTARRSFATNLYLKTLDLYLVSTLMGHSDIKVTQTYLCCALRKIADAKAYADQFQVSA